MENQGVIQYINCKQCSNIIIKKGLIYCKACDTEVIHQPIKSCTMYKMKLNNNDKKITKILKVTKLYTESASRRKSLSQEKCLSMVQYSMKQKNFIEYFWTRIGSMEELSDYLIYTNQVSFLDLFLTKLVDIHKVGRISGFVDQLQGQIPINNNPDKAEFSPTIIARPIQVVFQPSFWEDLMILYFKYFHHIFLVFSASSFDPDTAPKSLLSAIYYSGFTIYHYRHPEVVSYMYTYALCNIKKIIHIPKISNIQALYIYGLTFVHQGDHSLGRACLSHATRMSHSLGISFNRKKLSAIDKYSRQLLSDHNLIHSNLNKHDQSKFGEYKEDLNVNFDIYDSKWQIPNSKLTFCSNDDERIWYSICSTQNSIVFNNCLAVSEAVLAYSSIQLEKEFDNLYFQLMGVYIDANIIFDKLLKQFQSYQREIMEYKLEMTVLHSVYLIQLYAVSVIKSASPKPDLVKHAIDKFQELSSVYSPSLHKKSKSNYKFYAIAFYLLSVYHKAGKSQKELISIELKKFMDIVSCNVLQSDQLIYLILKTQLNSKIKLLK